MNRAESEHNTLVAERGGRITSADMVSPIWEILFESTEELLARRLNEFQGEFAQNWAGRTILGSLVRSPEVNAAAIPGNHADHVLIYQGLIERILGFTMALFATQEFLPSFGDATSGWAYAQTYEFFEQRYDLKQGARVAPKCHIRQGATWFVTFNALNVVLMHELGHICGGHFNLLRNPTPFRGFAEMAGQEEGDKLEVPRAVVEWDADCFAATWCGRLLQSTRVMPPVKKWLANVVTFPGNDQMLLYGIAAHSLFRCLGFRRSLGDDFDPSGYPHPGNRGTNFLVKMMSQRARAAGINREADSELVRVYAQLDQVLLAHLNDTERDAFIDKLRIQHRCMNDIFDKHWDTLETVCRIRESWRQ